MANLPTTAPYYLVMFADRAELAEDIYELVTTHLTYVGVPEEQNIQSIRLVTPAADLPEVTIIETERELAFEVRMVDDPEFMVESISYSNVERNYVDTYETFVDGYPLN